MVSSLPGASYLISAANWVRPLSQAGALLLCFPNVRDGIAALRPQNPPPPPFRIGGKEFTSLMMAFYLSTLDSQNPNGAFAIVAGSVLLAAITAMRATDVLFPARERVAQ